MPILARAATVLQQSVVSSMPSDLSTSIRLPALEGLAYLAGAVRPAFAHSTPPPPSLSSSAAQGPVDSSDSLPGTRNPVFDSQPEITPVYPESEDNPDLGGSRGTEGSSSASSTLLNMIGWGLGWKRQ